MSVVSQFVGGTAVLHSIANTVVWDLHAGVMHKLRRLQVHQSKSTISLYYVDIVKKKETM